MEIRDPLKPLQKRALTVITALRVPLETGAVVRAVGFCARDAHA